MNYHVYTPAPSLAPEDFDRLLAERDSLPLKFFISVGTIGDFTRPTRLLHEILLAEGYPHRYIETNDGHAWGNYRALLDDLLIYFFGSGNASNQ